MSFTMTHRTYACLSVLLTITACVRAQDLTPTAPAQSRTIAIVNATIHPVSSDVIERGHIIFEDGVITSIGGGQVTVRGPAVMIDATGKDIYPGLIGAVTQLGLTEIGAVRATHDYNEVGPITPEVYAAVSVNPDSTLIPVTRSNGILVFGSFPTGGTIPGRASVMRADGWTYEDMTIEAYAGLVINWPRARPIDAWWMDQSDAEQRTEIRESLRMIDEVFDKAEAYAAARAVEPGKTDIRLEAMQEFLPTAEDQRPVFINANDVDQITSAVAWAIDRGLRPVIVGGRDADLASELLIKHDVPVIITGVNHEPRRADASYDAVYSLPARLQEAGVRWCMASGEETPHERNLPYNAGRAVAYGLDKEAAIRAITLWPAQILGVADRYGSLEVGKSATFIITDGSPLEITTHVERAFLDGRDIDLSNKQKVLNELYREKYRQMGLLEDEAPGADDDGQ